jgi:protein-disulfide isomerase
MFKSKIQTYLFRPVLAALFLAITLSNVQFVSETKAQSLDRPAVENIIREYLLENPELFLEVQQALEAKQEQLKQEQQMATLTEKKELLYNSPNQMIIGNPDAAITIVEFFDYNCSYCKRALNDMTRIVEENSDVKFVMKEFPVLGEPSIEAHRISLALIKSYPELYAEFHSQLLNKEGRKDGNSALALAVSLGADEETIKAYANDPSIMEAVGEAYELADGLGITGTPSYVVGNEVVFGAVGYDRLMPKIEALRK